jgi:pimeloyl-ACP methyl ester carboxylesterase
VSGVTTLVLLPGMDGTGDLFAPFVAALGQGFTTHIVRYPTDRITTVEELTAIARDALPTATPYALLGESFSGPIAIRLAFERPPHLRALVLCCSFARNPQARLARLASALLNWRCPLPPVGLISAALMGRYAKPSAKEALRTALASVRADVLRARMKQVLAVDTRDLLKRVTLPLLDLRAAQDLLVSTRSAKEVLRLAPQTQVTSLAGPHFLLQTQPEAAAAAVKAFLRQLKQPNHYPPQGEPP